MVDSISLNTTGPIRPGVFVGQTSLGTGAQPISNHAVGYLFGTTEEDYNSTKYSSLIPYKPTQITSVEDFVRKSGGVPTDAGSRITYDSVNAFFQNVGNTGILYFTRVTPTPEVILDFQSATFGYDYFAIKINGKYIGETDLGTVDDDGDPIYVLTTTGIDSLDNALDLYRILSEDTDFNFVYGVEQSPENVLASELRIFSKDPSIALDVQVLKAYKSSASDPLTTEVDLLSYTRSYYPAKDLVVRLKSRDATTGKSIIYVDGDSLMSYNDELLDVNGAPAPYIADVNNATVDNFKDLLGDYLENSLDISEVVVGQKIAISPSSNSGLNVGYYQAAPATIAGTTVAFAPTVGASTGTVTGVGTTFLTDFGSTDVFLYDEILYRVVSVTSDLAMTVERLDEVAVPTVTATALGTEGLFKVTVYDYAVFTPAGTSVTGTSVAFATNGTVTGVATTFSTDFVVNDLFLYDQVLYKVKATPTTGTSMSVERVDGEAVSLITATNLSTTGLYKVTVSDYAGYASVTGSNAAPTAAAYTLGGDVPTGNVTARTGYIPDSVQILYLEVAGENRVFVVNGANVTEIASDLITLINEVLVEKGLDKYYEITNVSDVSASATTYLPNNGLDLVSAADHGLPTIRPELATTSPTQDSLKLAGTVSISEGSTSLVGVRTSFLTDLWVGATVYLADGDKFVIEEITTNSLAVVERASLKDISGKSFYLDKSEANGFYSFDYVAKIRIVSKNGSNPPVVPGLTRDGLFDSNVRYLPASSEFGNYITYKYSKPAKAQDFVYAISNAFRESVGVSPGFVFAPEAYASLVPDNTSIFSKTEARRERLKITSAIAALAEGRSAGDNNVGIQHIGLIDCGGDIADLPEARDELVEIRSTVGSAYGHLSYYAPYVINGVGNKIPLSGYVAGVACSRYLNEGFQQPPAGARYPLRDASGLTFTISSQQQEVTYGLGLNPARELPNRGIVLWGARTISSNPLFKFLNTRAILNVLVDVMSRSFDDLLFEQIDSPLSIYNRVYAVAASILNQFYRQGALFGNRPELAYSIICDDTNNDSNGLEQGIVVCDVYVATSPTLEKLLISVARTPAGQIAAINDSFARTSDRIASYVAASSLVRR